ncbi:hypothetical protein DEO72_LG9g2238 [Vigna unguiculata]|uniref:Uncharacterized protein n=1 Tax=Vigna unguiculata TaxID=3917 RepID=A0A4D6N312_VIGUN|nr:hypothetical protein DEO72_LG9g2238 [Vigna unguiculata]
MRRDAVPFPLTGVRRGGATGGGRRTFFGGGGRRWCRPFHGGRAAIPNLVLFSFQFLTHTDAFPFPLTGVRRGGATGGGRRSFFGGGGRRWCRPFHGGRAAIPNLVLFSFQFSTHTDAFPFPLTGVRHGGATGGGRRSFFGGGGRRWCRSFRGGRAAIPNLVLFSF